MAEIWTQRPPLIITKTPNSSSPQFIPLLSGCYGNLGTRTSPLKTTGVCVSMLAGGTKRGCVFSPSGRESTSNGHRSSANQSGDCFQDDQSGTATSYGGERPERNAQMRLIEEEERRS
ncbi:unnamed protein product [Pleuronectes platessa]|uniref:Uncharacterized protein n=1 Tax=Pleuronectes platessa TaxID=8262 RepID=A0A9N7UUH1_PLEPL|nr:unnamed protein product [Pleuronectes platessa]